MEITVNGEKREVPEGLTVQGLLAHLEVRESRVAVEKNRAIVKKADYEDTPVEPGDVLEIVSFVGGG